MVETVHSSQNTASAALTKGAQETHEELISLMRLYCLTKQCCSSSITFVTHSNVDVLMLSIQTCRLLNYDALSGEAGAELAGY